VTGFRGVAALQVVAFHYYGAFLVTAPWWINNLLSGAISLIDMFFIMSGFVLAYMYLEPRSGTGTSARRFYAGRFARIYPIYALALVIAIPLWMHDFLHRYPGSLKDALEYAGISIVMLQAWSPKLATVVNFPAWSLSVEVFFYLLFPFIVIPFTRLKRRQLLFAAVIIWLVTLVAPTVYAVLNPDGMGVGFPTHYGRWIRIVLYDPAIRAPEFLLGVVTGLIFLQRGEARERPLGPWLSVPAAIGIVAVMLVSSAVPFALLHNGLLAPLFAMLIYGVALGGGPLAWLLRKRAIVILGEASYGIYILQDPLWMLVVQVGRALTGTRGIADPWLWYRTSWWMPWLFAPLLVAFSIGVLYVYQEPSRRWLARKLGARAPRVPTVHMAPPEMVVAGAGESI
jgi:peptidoglycan/LPS O-acetylase OafA/YrhL